MQLWDDAHWGWGGRLNGVRKGDYWVGGGRGKKDGWRPSLAEWRPSLTSSAIPSGTWEVPRSVLFPTSTFTMCSLQELYLSTWELWGGQGGVNWGLNSVRLGACV